MAPPASRPAAAAARPPGACSVEQGTATGAASPRQMDALRHLAAYAAENGYPPTVRELGALLGVTSTNGVVGTLNALERKGLIRRVRRSGRAISLTYAGRSALL